MLSDDEINALAKGLASAPAVASVEAVPEAEEPESAVADEEPEEPPVIQDDAVAASGEEPGGKAEPADSGTGVLLYVLVGGFVLSGLLFWRLLGKRK